MLTSTYNWILIRLFLQSKIKKANVYTFAFSLSFEKFFETDDWLSFHDFLVSNKSSHHFKSAPRIFGYKLECFRRIRIYIIRTNKPSFKHHMRSYQLNFFPRNLKIAFWILMIVKFKSTVSNQYIPIGISNAPLNRFALFYKWLSYLTIQP